MKVKQLVAFLQQQPQELEVVETRYSDLGEMNLDDWGITQAIPQNGGWMMRMHHSMTEADRARAVDVLHFSGN